MKISKTTTAACLLALMVTLTACKGGGNNCNTPSNSGCVSQNSFYGILN